MFFRSNTRLLKKALALYAGTHVLERVIRDGDAALELGGTPIDLTILSVDVVPFTNISMHLSGQALLTFMERYHEAVAKEISLSGGILDSMHGDAVIAWWGLSGGSDHPSRACTCAKQILTSIHAINEDSKIADLPPLKLRMGIHTGSVLLGNFGSSERIRYSVLGANVNHAYRLCSLAHQEYPHSIVISSATKDRLFSDFSPQFLDKVMVKGHDESVLLFTI